MAGTNGIKSAAAAGWRGAFKQWQFTSAGYSNYGLLHDDLLYESPEVLEALRRLPRKMTDDRQFRQSRALYLSMRKEILPETEWTKYELDVRYLKPLIEEVEREFAEKQEWNNK